MPSVADEQEPRDANPGRLSGEISSVSGRRAQGGGKGLPALDNVSLTMDDGQTLDFSTPKIGEQKALQALGPVIPIYPLCFLVCPICLLDKPTKDEHVPAEALGGEVMTVTCQRCNNDLGSRVESEFQDWFDNVIGSVTFAREGVQGRRRVHRLILQQTSGGEFGLMIDGKVDPEIERILIPGEFSMQYRLPDPQRYAVAALKHAYLAACLHLGYVPDTDEAKAIRADLLAARDTPKRKRTPRSAFAERLMLGRTYQPPSGPTLGLVHGLSIPESEPVHLISLAGTVIVRWPFEDVPPRVGQG